MRLNLEAGWQHTFGKKDTESVLAFAEGSRPFAVRGVPLNRDEALAGLGLTFTITDNVSLSADYRGALGTRVQEHAGELSLTALW